MWFAHIGGKQTPLNISDPGDEAGAARERQRLVDELAAAVARRLATPSREAGAAPAAAPERTVAGAVAEFLRARKPKLSPGAWECYRFALEVHLAAAFGPRPLASLTADELEAWADRPGWSSSYRHNTLGAVMTFLRWAGRPLTLARPPKESRGAGAVLTDDQFARVLAAYDGAGGGDFRELLRALRETGARPQEVAGLTAEGVDWGNACARLSKHKSARHGKARTLHFSAAALAILEGQRARHGSGLLFRTTRGGAYSKKAICRNMLKISGRVGFRAFAYGAGRHSFATKALCKGVPDTVVAALLGHSGTQMVHSNYCHVSAQSRVLKAALEKISSEDSGSAPAE